MTSHKCIQDFDYGNFFSFKSVQICCSKTAAFFNDAKKCSMHHISVSYQSSVNMSRTFVACDCHSFTHKKTKATFFVAVNHVIFERALNF